MITDDNDLDTKSGAYFPIVYLTQLYDFLDAKKDLYNIINYDDLKWEVSDESKHFDREWENWKQHISCNHQMQNKIHILIQYDIDSFAWRTNQLLKHPSHKGIKANVMIFKDRINRLKLQHLNDVALTKYEIDIEFLKANQNKEFLVGYHTNAYERSKHEMHLAQNIFEQDIEALREHFEIRYFSAHGGIPDKNNVNNNQLKLPKLKKLNIKWVHNGGGPKFHGEYSDGGHFSERLNPEERDLRDFIKTMQPGQRYRILIHPQYYCNDFEVSARYTGTEWYDKMLTDYHNCCNLWVLE